MSLFASSMSMFDSNARKKGQSQYISRSSSRPPSPLRAASASTAAPNPYHPGSIIRDSDQEKTQGIARKSSMWSVFLREAGRLPTCRSAISVIGVAVRKNCTKPGVS